MNAIRSDIRKALDSCKDAKLFVAMNLAFACSLRVGEILGLTWNNVSISDEDIAKDDASVYVDRELFRASKEVMDTLGNRDILFVFPPVMGCPKTRLILKTPKTATSVRRVWLPKTLAYILREWRDTQQKQKEFLGDEYFDYDLVVAHHNGRPCDCKNIEKSFNRLKEDAGLPNVVFHSLHHSSTTYKLKLNHGDIKATQGDTGHAQADMITRVYAHILDEDRKVAASIIMSQHNFRAKEKAPKVLIYEAFGLPGAIRTRGLSLRRRTLYPAELRRQIWIFQGLQLIRC